MSEAKTAADDHDGGYAGQQGWIRWRRRCGTETEEMWDDRDDEMGWKNGNGLGKYRQGTTTNLRAYFRSNNLGVGEMTDLHGDSGCIWRLCVSYCNINKITRLFKYPSWRFKNVIIHPGKAKYRTTKGESQIFGAKSAVMFELQ